MNVSKEKSGFSVKAHQGDARTLLAFNLSKAKAKNLAGFTIHCAPKGLPAYYIFNTLQYEKPGDHAQVKAEPVNSSVNAPIHKFRWLHVPGTNHQGTTPFYGPYTYTVTPRYFDAKGSMQALDDSLSVAVTINVQPFTKGKVEVGFTRGFTQSQAFVHHFGKKAKIPSTGATLDFDTSKVAGKNDKGVSYTIAEQYEWLGFTARQKILGIANEVLANKALTLDVFAYDFNEPDIVKIFLQLAAQGRIRMILDNAALHANKDTPTKEDQFEAAFNKAAKSGAEMKRGKFGRFSHDKIFIVKKGGKAQKVLTGSTNFSVTGLYVNSNHVVIFNDTSVAATYASIFQAAWDCDVKQAAFEKLPAATQTFSLKATGVPTAEVTFSPHPDAFATSVLQGIADRVTQEGKVKSGGSVIFAVMGMDPKATGPVFPALRAVHSNQNIFSYGVSDSPGGIALYSKGSKRGVLVTGKPVQTKLPPPFDQVPGLGLGHQIHHKFIVCGFNGKNPVVYCGSSNLALGGEEVNGDNLIAIHDADVATVFAIEAIGLVDHFSFLNAHANAAKENNATDNAKPAASKTDQAKAVRWFLSTSDAWAKPYFDPKDLHCGDRELFA